ncbi:hypothetical protein [Streptomyces sp. NPDC005303]
MTHAVHGTVRRNPEESDGACCTGAGNITGKAKTGPFRPRR